MVTEGAGRSDGQRYPLALFRNSMETEYDGCYSDVLNASGGGSIIERIRSRRGRWTGGGGEAKTNDEQDHLKDTQLDNSSPATDLTENQQLLRPQEFPVGQVHMPRSSHPTEVDTSGCDEVNTCTRDSSWRFNHSKINHFITEQDSSHITSSRPSDCGSDKGHSADSVDTSWSIDQGSSSSVVVERRTSSMLDRLMSRLQEWLESNLRKLGTQDGRQTARHGSASAVTDFGHSSRSSRSQNTIKRRRSDFDDEFGGDDGQRLDPDRNKLGKTTDTAETRYVCPFFKHNHERYQTCQWKNCCWPGWASVHRVKEHLYRRHMLPKFRCNRCRQDLKSAFNLNEHQRSDVICQRQNQEPEDEGIDEEQERLLRARKRKNGKARQKGEEDKWVEMYKIIFPHDDPIPSPYAELCPFQTDQYTEQHGANVLDSFEGFARREFSRRMRPRMESLIDGILEQTLTSEAITDVANSVFQGIMETFRANQGQAACQSKAEGSPSRSPSPEGVRIEGAPHVPQYNDGFEHNPNPDIEINIEEILKSLDDDQYLDLEPWPTEIDAVNTFQPLGLQFEQYNKANA